MQRWPRLSTSLLVLIGACANTCGGGRQGAAPSAPAIAPAAPKPGATETSAINEPHPAWQPAADTELTRRLRAAQAEIETDRTFGELASTTKLGAVLPSKIGELSAEGAVASTEQRSGPAQFVAVARNYVLGAASARVKITDTAQMPSARHVLSSHLALIGNEAAGHEHGAFVREAPALLAHGDAYSRAIALVGGRFLVQINVQGSADPNAAQSLLEKLDWSALATEPTDATE